MNNIATGPLVLTPAQLGAIRRGLEKESLRARLDARLAASPHPAALGSALTHPHITTDFSESQLELITSVHATPEQCIAELVQIQRFTAQALQDEMLWVSSMPCELPADAQIPLGQYGNSNVGRAKTVYRNGLGHRYGRRMQTISGIHYNWSLPDISSARYFALIRNFRRQAFLLLYLFGASPAVCASFVAGRQHPLQALGDGSSMALPYATSLRMGRLGYQSDAQASLAVSYNSLEGYASSLESALTQPYAPYEAIGVRGPDGEYRQLQTALLQIENEFYGTIRPKRVIRPGERPLHALRQRGVEYVEVRLMDLDPFEEVGISVETLRFLDVFLLHCLEQPSPPDSPAEIAALARNQQKVAERGREPGLLLERNGAEQTLTSWGQEIIQALWPIAARLDAVHQTDAYSSAVQNALQGLENPDSLPSARVLRSMQQEFAGSFVAFARARSEANHAAMRAQEGLAADAAQVLKAQSAQSLLAQTELESADQRPFDEYLQEYLQPQRLHAENEAAEEFAESALKV